MTKNPKIKVKKDVNHGSQRFLLMIKYVKILTSSVVLLNESISSIGTIREN